LEGERTVWREKGQFGGRKDSLEGERTVWREKGQFGGRKDSFCKSRIRSEVGENIENFETRRFRAVNIIDNCWWWQGK
jgi:hypothetical protein